MNRYQVTLLPENKTVKVAAGTNLLLAARKAGIHIDSPCGQRGTCGKCAVRVVSGQVDDCATAHMPEELLQQGFAAGCQIHVNSDMTVEVPSFSRLEKTSVLISYKRSRVAGGQDYFAKKKMNPVCRKIVLTLSPPELDDVASDLERVEEHLMELYGLRGVRILPKALRKLPVALRQGNWTITATVTSTGGNHEIMDIEPGRSQVPVYGLAVDLGTTTIAVNLLNLETGRIVAKAGAYNQQSVYGSDVITRIVYTDEHADGLEKLHRAMVDTINTLISDVIKQKNIKAEDIKAVVCAGNTVISHFFLNIPATYIRLEPYIPAVKKFPPIKAGELGIGINPDAPVIVMPAVASYIGGDITSGVLATRLAEADQVTLFIDIGTNGELVLGNREWMVTCACSAGPSFEGSGISCGMRAMDGAIERADITRNGWEVKVKAIGDEKPLGVCGSGLINIISEMLKAGIIDRSGRILMDKHAPRVREGNEGKEFVLVFAEESGSGRDIVITDGDIKNLIRAKGAVFAGIMTMLKMMEMQVEDIKTVYIAGGFGNYIHIPDAVGIGLLPDIPVEKYVYVGNSSIQGAMIALLCQEALKETLDIARKMTYLELSVGNAFMEEFISALFIPHTDLSLFKSANPCVTNVV